MQVTLTTEQQCSCQAGMRLYWIKWAWRNHFTYLCRWSGIGSKSFFLEAFCSKQRITCFLCNMNSSSVFIFSIKSLLPSEETEDQWPFLIIRLHDIIASKNSSAIFLPPNLWMCVCACDFERERGGSACACVSKTKSAINSNYKCLKMKFNLPGKNITIRNINKLWD